MAHTFSITNGTTTVTLTPANGYVIIKEDLGTSQRAAPNADPDNPEIESSFDLVLTGTNGPDMQAKARAVELLLQQAERRQRKPEGPRVYFQVQIDQEANTHRAEITEGRFPPNEALTNWYSNTARFDMLLTHRAWESPRAEVPVSSFTEATAATGGRVVGQSGSGNFIQIHPNAIGGSLPAWAELEITNTSGAEVDFRNFYFGLNNWGSGFLPWFEGEESAQGSDVASGTNSGGFYNNYSTTGTGFIQFDVSSHMDKSEGRKCKAMIRCHGFSGSGLYVRPVVRDVEGLIPLYESEKQEVLLSAQGSGIIDLDSVPLPPGGYNPTANGAVFELKLRATGAFTVNLDYVHFMPLDSYQHIKQLGYGIVNNGVIIFDNIEQLYKHADKSIFSVREGRLKVFPSVNYQRLYMLADEGTSSNVARTFSVKLFVRERRLTI